LIRKSAENGFAMIGRVHEVEGTDIMCEIDQMKSLVMMQDLSLHHPDQRIRGTEVGCKG
jgi:hypothetical protein